MAKPPNEVSADLVIQERINSMEIVPTIFKAYDIRGKTDVSLTESAVEAIGLAFAERLQRVGETRLVIGRDGRLSSKRLQQAFMRGVASQNISIIDLGEVTSPMVYFAAETLEDVNSCAVITGSHNPPEDNGIKLVLQGNALYGEQIQALRERIEFSQFDECLLQAKNLPGWGRIQAQKKEIFPAYCQRATTDIVVKRPLKVVVDAGNGVAANYAPVMLREVGCEVIELFCEVDGNFPNHHPDPAKPENLVDMQHAVLSTGADIGFAFDGDGDRCGVVDSSGEILDPDRQLIIFAQSILREQSGIEVLYDVKCSALVKQLVEASGGKATLWKTGHSLMKAKMKETGALLGGEWSGHLFFKHRWYGFDDGIYTALRLVELLSGQSQNSHDWFCQLPVWTNTPEIHVPMQEGEAEQLVEALIQAFEKHMPDNARLETIDGLRVDFKDGWGLARASNTTATLSLRFEATSESELTRIQRIFKQRMTELPFEVTMDF